MKRRNQKLMTKVMIPLLVMGQVMSLMAMPVTQEEKKVIESYTLTEDIKGEEHKLTQEEIVKVEATDVLSWEGVEYSPNLACDGDASTYWQTSDFALGANDGTKPVELTLELKEIQALSRIELLARQDHQNGGIKEYELYVAMEEGQWTKVTEGIFDAVAGYNSPPQFIELESPVKAKYVKLVVEKGVAENVSLAEMEIYVSDISQTQDTTLKSIGYNLGDKQENLAVIPGKVNYSVVLPVGTVQVPQLIVEVNDPQATFEITQPTTPDGEASVKVTNGEAVQIYKIDFSVRAASSDATLKSLKYNGRTVKGFNKDQLSYDVILPFGTSQVTLEAVTTHEGADVTVDEPTSFPGVGSIMVQAEDGTTQVYTINFTVATEEGGHLAKYAPDFDTMTTADLNWEATSGGLTKTLENGKLKLDTTGVMIGLDKNSPKLTNGELSVDMSIAKGTGRTGFIVRGIDKGNYTAICYDNGNWVWVNQVNGVESYGTLFSYTLKNNETYNLRIKYKDSDFKIYINGENVYSGSIGGASVREGYLGMRTWFDDKTIYLDNLVVKETEEAIQPGRPEDAEWINLSGGETTVVVDSSFPAIQKYSVKGEEAFKGQLNYSSAVSINGEVLYPKRVEYNKVSDSQMMHTLYLSGEIDEQNFEAAVTTSIKVETDEVGDSIVTFEVVDIKETGDVKIKSIQFPNQSLVTVDDIEGGYGLIKCSGGWHGISEEVVSLKDIAKGTNGGTYGFLYNGKYSAAIDNNVMESGSKLSIAHEVDGNNHSASFSSGAFTYREVDEEVALAGGLSATEALPQAKIVISGDNNADGVLDWQDGAVAFRKIVKEPKGSDRMRESMSYIAMNFVSNAANPFLRVLDNAKVLSHYTDGFGQNILNKGYQAEGHDDSFPSFANIGVRVGGAEDFNILGKAGEDYNINTGVHVNINEYMLDSTDIDMDNMIGELGKLSAGWGWLDQAYYVNQKEDLVSGEIERRFEELDQAVPTLDFLYVDVYSGAGWHAKKSAEIINDKGWFLATEFGGPFEGDQVFTHWGTDLYYPTTSASSNMYRFVFNHMKDMFATDTLLKGSQMPGVGSWQNQTNMFEGVEIFYNQNLPTKYMQHFPIIKMTEDRIDFEQGVHVQKEADRVKLYGKEGQLVADMSTDPTRCKTTLFIPWDPITEDKIYHWNNEGGTTTWKLPASWEGTEQVHVYETTSVGREYVGAVDVIDGTVTMEADKQIGYVVTKEKDQSNGLPEETIWGEGSEIKDPGFNSLEFGKVWDKSSVSGNTEHIQMVRDAKFNTELHLAGTEDAVVEQEIIELKPGKSYSVSAWINTTRPVTVGVQMGDEIYENKLDNNKIINGVEQHKYKNTKYQRVQVDFTVPENLTTAKVYFYTPQVEAEGVAKIDDVRIVELPGQVDRKAEGAVYFDDFENVDEGWGPFEYAGGPGQTHLAYKDDEGKQIIDYVIEGNWSLKSNETGKTGEIFRTYPSKVPFKPNKTYQLSMDYTIFKDQHGLFKPSAQNTLTATLKDGKGNVIATQKLINSTIDTSINKANAEQLVLSFDTKGVTDTSDMYFCIEATNGSVQDILMVDNFKLEVTENHEVNTISDVKLENGQVTVSFDEAVEGVQAEELAVTLDINGIEHPIAFTSFNYNEQTKQAVATFEPLGVKEYFQRAQLKVVYKGYQALSNPIVVDENHVIVEPYRMTIGSVTQVKGGESFAVNVGIDKAEQPVYATDLTVAYDTNLFELENINEIAPTEIVDKVEMDGAVRVLTFAEGGLVGNLKQLAFNFKAKEVTKDQNGEIRVNDAKIGVVVDGVSQNIPGLAATQVITVKGEETETFMPEDVNKDNKVNVADLALIAYYYMRSSGEAGWDEAKRADVNKDGIINLEDLSRVASKILE